MADIWKVVLLILISFSGLYWLEYRFKQYTTNRNKSLKLWQIVFIRIYLFVIGLLLILFIHQGKQLIGYGLTLPNPAVLMPWLIICGSIVITLSYFFSRRSKNYKLYPLIRINTWDKWDISINIISWTLYLFSYEFLFRGILLFSTYRYVGLFYAIQINIVLYVIVHLPKGFKESLGSIPFGILLCFSALDSGSMITPFLIHLVLAISNDMFSIKHNPEMKIKISY